MLGLGLLACGTNTCRCQHELCTPPATNSIRKLTKELSQSCHTCMPCIHGCKTAPATIIIIDTQEGKTKGLPKMQAAIELTLQSSPAVFHIKGRHCCSKLQSSIHGNTRFQAPLQDPTLARLFLFVQYQWQAQTLCARSLC